MTELKESGAIDANGKHHGSNRDSTSKEPTDSISEKEIISIKTTEFYLPWPEEDNSGAILDVLQRIYSTWTYAYMNRIFRKGNHQHQENREKLSQKDLYLTPNSMEADYLRKQFW